MSAFRWLEETYTMPDALAGFDSSTTLFRALGRSLEGQALPAIGVAPKSVAQILPYGNYLPEAVRRKLYRVGTAIEGIDPDRLGEVKIEQLREWAVDRYPKRGYPAVMIGSTNGAAIHLAALLGIPWLPQTFLIPVRRTVDPNQPKQDLAWGREHAPALLEANPDITVHQAFDPNQDQLTVKRAAYFRVKSRRLGPAYESFLDTVLEPGGTIISVECDLEWPTTHISDRHVYQFGAPGGLQPEEYREGSPRVAAFLDAFGDGQAVWDAPEADGHSTEAEWGFDPTLREDMQRFVDDRGHQLKRLSFEGTNDLSGLVADFYREQYRSRGVDGQRLLVGSFAFLQPWWTLRTGSVPYWLTFNAEFDAADIETYLDERESYDRIALTPVSNGVPSAGQASIERWQAIVDQAETDGTLLGVTPDKYPADYGSYYRYNAALPREIPDRQPLAVPVSLEGFEQFLEDADREYPVEWVDG